MMQFSKYIMYIKCALNGGVLLFINTNKIQTLSNNDMMEKFLSSMFIDLLYDIVLMKLH